MNATSAALSSNGCAAGGVNGCVAGAGPPSTLSLSAKTSFSGRYPGGDASPSSSASTAPQNAFSSTMAVDFASDVPALYVIVWTSMPAKSAIRVLLQITG